MSPRNPRRTMRTPAVPGSCTGRPLASAANWAFACGRTSYSGVPAANVSFRVSPEAIASVIAGDPEAASGLGHAWDWFPDDVQVSTTGLATGFATGWPAAGEAAPQPHRKATTNVKVMPRISLPPKNWI